MLRVELPEYVSTREMAQECFHSLPGDLSDQVVVLDCRRVEVSTPSFFDEAIKEILVNRSASSIELLATSERARTQAARSAENRHVADKIRFVQTT